MADKYYDMDAMQAFYDKLKTLYAKEPQGVYYVEGGSDYAAYSSSKTYTATTSSGPFTEANSCVYGGVAYFCKTTISTPEAWNSSHWTIMPTPVLTGTIDGVTELYKGLKIAYKFNVRGGTSSTYLNINGLGNHYIRRNDSNTTTHLPINTVVFLCYDGTYWSWADYDGDSWASTIGAYCSTAAATQAKAATSVNHVYTAGEAFLIRFVYANSYAGKITLNINSQGAKDIWINGKVSSSSNYTLPAGEHWCYYDGTVFHIWTDGTAQFKKLKAESFIGDVSGNVTGVATSATSASAADYATSAGAAPVASHTMASHSDISDYFSSKSALSALTSKSALSAGSAAKAAALSNTAYRVASATSATNADRWTTPRTIGASGDITWSVVTNGSANVTSAASINNVPWSAISSYAAAVDTSTTNKFTTPKAVNDAITGAMTTKASFKGPYTAKSNIPAADLDHLSIFLVGPTGTGDDKYEEYILPATGTTTAHLLQIGDTTTDLSNYALKNSSYGSLSAGYASSTNTAQTMKSAMSAATASYAVSAGAAPVASHNHNYKLSGAGTALDVSAGINLKPNGNIAISTAANTINISAKDTTYTSLNSINSTQYNALTGVSGVKDIKNYAAISAISGTTSKGSFAPSNSADTFTLIAGNNIDFVSGANSLTISSKSYSIPTVNDKQIKITTGTSPSTGSFTTNQSTTGQIVLGSMALASTSDYSLTSHNHNYTLSGNGTAVNVSAGVNFKPSGSNIKFYVSGNDIYISAKNDNSTAYIPSGFQVSAINGTTTGVYYLSAFKLNAGTNIGFTSASNSQITITAKDTTYTSLNGINSTEYNALTSTSANSRNPNAHQLSSHTNFATYFNGTSANSALTSKSALSAGSATKAVSASGANSASFALSSNIARNGNFFEDSVGCPASHNSGSTYAVGDQVSTANSAFSAKAAVPTGSWNSVSSKFARLPQVTWTITDSTITGLYKGLQLWIKVPCYGGTSGSNATMLSINGSASKQVRYNNSNYTSHYVSGVFIHLTYDGSYFQVGDRTDGNNYVAQSSATDNQNYPIILKRTTGGNETQSVKYSPTFTYNPSLNKINACSGFNINYQSATNPNKNILFLGSDNVANNLQSFVDSKLVISEKSKLSDTSTTVNNDVFAVKGGGTIYSQALDVYANYTPTQTTSTVKFNYKPDHTSPTGTRWTDIRTFKDTDAGSYYQPFLVMSQNGMLMPTDVKIVTGGYGSPYYDCLITKSMTAESAYYTNLTSPNFSAANVSAANISATSVTGLNFVADNNNILKFSTSLYQIILTGGIQNIKPLLQFKDNSSADISYTLGNAADYWGGQTYDYGGNIDRDVACGIKNIYYFIRTSTTTAKIAFSSFNANKNKVFSFITSNTGTAGYKQIESTGWNNKNVSIKNHIGTSANMSVDKLIINIGTTANNVTGSQGQYTINISAKKANVSLMPNGSNSYWLIVDDS